MDLSLLKNIHNYYNFNKIYCNIYTIEYFHDFISSKNQNICRIFDLFVSILQILYNIGLSGKFVPTKI